MPIRVNALNGFTFFLSCLETQTVFEEYIFVFQETLTRFVTVSLVGNPNLEKPTDVKRIRILELCEKVAAFDPEFILKVSGF